jgi:hypothetical protein
MPPAFDWNLNSVLEMPRSMSSATLAKTVPWTVDSTSTNAAA